MQRSFFPAWGKETDLKVIVAANVYWKIPKNERRLAQKRSEAAERYALRFADELGISLPTKRERDAFEKVISIIVDNIHAKRCRIRARGLEFCENPFPLAPPPAQYSLKF